MKAAFSMQSMKKLTAKSSLNMKSDRSEITRPADWIGRIGGAGGRFCRTDLLLSEGICFKQG